MRPASGVVASRAASWKTSAKSSENVAASGPSAGAEKSNPSNDDGRLERDEIDRDDAAIVLAAPLEVGEDLVRLLDLAVHRPRPRDRPG